MSIKEGLLKALKDNVKVDEITIAGAKCYVRALTVGETNAMNDALEVLKQKKAKEQGVSVDEVPVSNESFQYLICNVLCDEHGERLFDINNPDDLAVINSLPISEIETITQKINGAQRSKKK